MADIQPFRASRYALTLRDRLRDLATPPYDVITPEMQDALYERHPNNLVRIDFGREAPDDDADRNKYARAAALWREWNEQGVIRRDELPGFYVYEQEFDLPGRGRRCRRGFFAAVRLESLEEGIRAHERTFEGPKADRLNLTRATGANLSPVFCIYDDPLRQADAIVAQSVQERTPRQFLLDDIAHRLWVIDHPRHIEVLVKAMADKRLYIADGHHRYETALNYRNEMRKKTGRTGGDQPFDATLMFLVNIHDEGMEILPTHRVLPGEALGGREAEKILGDLGEHFEIEKIPSHTDPDQAAMEWTRRLAHAGEGGRAAFVAVLPAAGAYLMQLKPGVVIHDLIPDADLAEPVKRLDVTILHRCILPKFLGGDRELGHDDLHYVKGAADVARMIQRDHQAAAFLLNPTRMEQVIEIAGLGVRMPQKSTYFYPKILTGLAMRDMNAEAGD